MSEVDSTADRLQDAFDALWIRSEVRTDQFSRVLVALNDRDAAKLLDILDRRDP